MSTMSANIESHIVSILKRDVFEDQMMDSNSRLEGHIRQENLIGSTDAGEMCLSETRLQPVTGVPLSLCRMGEMCLSETRLQPVTGVPLSLCRMGEMCLSEARLQPVTGVPPSLCRMGEIFPSEAGMPLPRATPQYKGQATTYKQGMRDKRLLGSFEVAIDAV